MLTDAQLRKTKAGDKAFRLNDSGGLHLFVTPTGGKLWRLRYKIDGREKLLSLGPYPSVSLSEAREARETAKAELRKGRDPAVTKKLRAVADAGARGSTFEAIAREWHALQLPTWTKTHASDVMRALERDIFPEVGEVPIKDLTPATVLATLRKVEKRQAIETARRNRQRMSAIFVYAIASGRADTDPAAIVQGAMAPLVKGRQPAITDLEQAREILRRADATPAHPTTKLALRLLALTVVRPGTIATLPWSELSDLDDGSPVWRVPAARMKMRLHHKDNEARDHLVPLSKQALRRSRPPGS